KPVIERTSSTKRSSNRSDSGLKPRLAGFRLCPQVSVIVQVLRCCNMKNAGPAPLAWGPRKRCGDAHRARTPNETAERAWPRCYRSGSLAAQELPRPGRGFGDGLPWQMHGECDGTRTSIPFLRSELDPRSKTHATGRGPTRRQSLLWGRVDPSQ